MMLTGSWMSSTFQAGPNGDKIGFFLVPPAAEGGNKMSTGGTSLAYGIRASSPNANLAAEYIDYLMSDKAAKAWVSPAPSPWRPWRPRPWNRARCSRPGEQVAADERERRRRPLPGLGVAHLL